MPRGKIENQLSMFDFSEIIINDNISNKDFKNEKHLQNYLSDNIELFCLDMFNEKYKAHELEKSINTIGRRFGPRGKRIDLYIETENNKYIIEIKNPKCAAEMRSAIGQILDYGREFDDTHTLVLLSTTIDFDTIKTIQHYNLKIKYIYMSKTQMMLFKDFEKPTHKKEGGINGIQNC